MPTYEFPIRSFYINKRDELYVQTYENETFARIMRKHTNKYVAIKFGKNQVYGRVIRSTKSSVYFKDWSFIQ